MMSLIARCSLGSSIEPLLSIHVKQVVMMAVAKLDLDRPRAVRLAFHRMSIRVPFIKISDKRDMSGFGRITNKIDRSEIVFG